MDRLRAMGADELPDRARAAVRGVGPCVVPSSKLLAEPRLVCRPEARTLLGYTRRVLHLQPLNKLAAFSYSSVGPANWLFLIDIATGSAERFDVPGGEVASHGAALGSDGNIYTATPRRFHRFLVSERRWETLKDLGGDELPWDAVGGTNGRIYWGTYPNTHFAQYDIATDALTLWEKIEPDAKYLLDFRWLPGGVVRFRATGETTHVITFDPRREQFVAREKSEDPGYVTMMNDPVENTLPAASPLAGDARVETISLRHADGSRGRRVAISVPSGRIAWVDDHATLTPFARGPAGFDVWKLIAVDDRNICGLGWSGAFFRFNVQSRELIENQLPNSSPDSNSYYVFEAPTPRVAVGGHYSQQNLFRADLDTGAWEASPGMIAPVPGEPTASVSLHGKVYLGIYIDALLQEYDPTRPIAYGDNPRQLLKPGHHQNRPRGLATDGRRLFMASWRMYGTIGGALTVYDIHTGTHEVYTEPFKDLNLDALAVDPASGHVFGGTFRWGDGDSCPPRRDAAVVYEWDPAARRVVREAAPWPDADLTRVLGVLPGGIVVVNESRKAQAALLDARDLSTLWRGVIPGGLHAVRVLPDGGVYALTTDHLARWDVAHNTLHPIAPNTRDMMYLSIPRPGLFVMASPTAIYRLDLQEEA